MIKRKVVAVFVGVALLVTMFGTTGILADAVGFEVTQTAHACSGNGGGGGGC